MRLLALFSMRAPPPWLPLLVYLREVLMLVPLLVLVPVRTLLPQLELALGLELESVWAQAY